MNAETGKALISFIKGLVKTEYISGNDRPWDSYAKKLIDEDGIKTLINIVKALANLKEGDL